MKKVYTYILCFLCCFIFVVSSYAQVTLQKSITYDLKKAQGFKGDHGIIVIKTSNDYQVKVKLETKNSYQLSTDCGTVNGKFNLYEAYTNTTYNGNFQHKGNSGRYYKKLWGNYKCKSANTDDINFYKFMAKRVREKAFGLQGFSKPATLEVNLFITLTGNVSIDDLLRIKLPDGTVLGQDDFVEKVAFNEDHDCYNNNSGVCAELKKVRSISNLNKTDLVIQAHRGIWGKPYTNQENTLGAMIAAKDRSYKLLESDIMPIGVTNYTNPGNTSTFGKPADLACFHDFVLSRYTSASNGFIFNSTRNQLENLSLKKPRSNTNGNEKIMFFDELVNYAVNNNLIVCVDMKNLESKGQGNDCEQLCQWQTQDRKDISLYQNLKYAINNTSTSKLKHLAIKTYKSYNELKQGLTTGSNAVSIARFNKVLWAPLLAGGSQWEKPDGTYDANKIQKFLEDWFFHNESVLYYETNFFNDYDNKTSVMLDNSFTYREANGSQKLCNIMEYIYRVSGRRAGTFSEEPVGGKGTVNRWGKWKIKNPNSDRRGDHLWLLKYPFFKHAVITTDRPDIWDQLKD